MIIIYLLLDICIRHKVFVISTYQDKKTLHKFKAQWKRELTHNHNLNFTFGTTENLKLLKLTKTKGSIDHNTYSDAIIKEYSKLAEFLRIQTSRGLWRILLQVTPVLHAPNFTRSTSASNPGQVDTAVDYPNE